MPSDQSSSHGAQPLLTGHPLPRRASPEKSITLRHHRLARDASLRFSLGSAPPNANIETFSPRRNSSSDGYETGQSDPKKWFCHSNQNPSTTVDNNIIDRNTSKDTDAKL
ncbi:frequency clock protein-domain-containing protein [Thelonectria olida]|uniref:Frequency clock protein-domain-containing protein n=1 Tax=Thelonectria olida TaxID=1576542 RepID=A0A9P9ALS8_9HYPO|nr:frequency clock protein-domain-containing protein [Thelonectria olida]